MSGLKLYEYWRSSAAYRLRIALNLKGVDYTSEAVNIAPGNDEQMREGYRALNPQMRVPMIEVDGQRAGQSMAVLEWLDETYPDPPLLPEDSWTRLQVRAFADVIGCDIHPLNNLSVLKKLKDDFGADQDAVGEWYRDWILRGFTALEEMAQAHSGAAFLFGDTPTLAEICLVPQVYNAQRYKTDLGLFPRLLEVDEACRALDAFARAAPDAVKPD
ncbi:maleylacetoacetate isomerase [Henriciella marina]|uniref:maleylacetoacetate isomerase n=1 Tax=Henriciella marina TaxID=453851 RepID=UPI0003768259|nr:maleylacetoacetate isomerase [Henriciella marina]